MVNSKGASNRASTLVEFQFELGQLPNYSLLFFKGNTANCQNKHARPSDLFLLRSTYF